MYRIKHHNCALEMSECLIHQQEHSCTSAKKMHVAKCTLSFSAKRYNRNINSEGCLNKVSSTDINAKGQSAPLEFWRHWYAGRTTKCTMCISIWRLKKSAYKTEKIWKHLKEQIKSLPCFKLQLTWETQVEIEKGYYLGIYLFIYWLSRLDLFI